MAFRCFIAIQIPDALKKSIGAVIEKLMKSGADVKWVPDSNIHITLKFLGNTDESLIEPIKESLNKKLLPYSPFYIRIYGTGCFPHSKRPRVIWVGIDKSVFLTTLQKDIDSEMAKFGYSLDDREFSPHLTIGRVRSQKRIPMMIRTLDEFRTHIFSDLEISTITLMRSELKPAGALYHSLAEIPFGRRNNVE